MQDQQMGEQLVHQMMSKLISAQSRNREIKLEYLHFMKEAYRNQPGYPFLYLALVLYLILLPSLPFSIATATAAMPVSFPISHDELNAIAHLDVLSFVGLAPK